MEGTTTYLKMLKKLRDNLVNLISVGAPAHKFLAELLDLRNVLKRFPELSGADTWAMIASVDAQNEIEAISEDEKKRHRASMLKWISKAILEIDEFLRTKQIRVPEVTFEGKEESSIMNEEKVKKCFIEKGPIKGVWLFEVPVNLKQIEEKAAELEKQEFWDFSLDKLENTLSPLAKYIDLVCIESAETKVVKAGRRKVTDYLMLRRMNEPVFNGKTVTLIEAKASEEKVLEAIDQILEYKRLFQIDWPHSTIKNVGIISGSWNIRAIKLCRKHNIRAWEVDCKEVRTLN